MASQYKLLILFFCFSTILSSEEKDLKITLHKSIILQRIFEDYSIEISIDKSFMIEDGKTMPADEIFRLGYDRGVNDTIEYLNYYSKIFPNDDIELLQNLILQALEKDNVIQEIEKENEELLAMNGMSIIVGYTLGALSGGLLSYIIAFRQKTPEKAFN